MSPLLRPAVLLPLGAVALGGLTLFNDVAARRAARDNRPRGEFLTQDGIRLHWRETGSGRPIVFLHGNAVAADDLWTSGLAQRLGHFRLIAFDRPGFGHSARPYGRRWNAAAQARLLRRAVRTLGVERPILVGHSWGTLVALEMALADRDDTAGLVLLSGYYHPTARKDVLMAGLNALPLVGDLLRNTVAPLMARVMLPLTKRKMFAPARPTSRFLADFDDAMAVRPLQLRASGADAATMVPDAAALSGRVGQLTMPTAILVGDADRIVEQTQAKQLHAAVGGSTLRILPDVGHMIHHVATGTVADAIDHLATRAPA